MNTTTMQEFLAVKEKYDAETELVKRLEKKPLIEGQVIEEISIYLISFKNFSTNCCAAFSKARDLSISVLFDTLPS